MDPKDLERDIKASKELRPGADNYRAFVGPPAQYDFMGGTQFALLFSLGLREESAVLDVGCGSLRAGRLLLQFLLPERYVGIEPNTWLWRDAVEKEIGRDILEIKKPTLLDDDSFSLSQTGRRFDFVVFQSILSHTGADLFDKALGEAAGVLNPGGQVLFTVLDEFSGSYSASPARKAQSGWIYPGCVCYERADVKARSLAAGLHAQRLEWFHPRQSWYRAVADADLKLNKKQMLQLGKGKPLQDGRF